MIFIDLSFLQMEYLFERACKSDFLVGGSCDSFVSFLFRVLAVDQSKSSPKKASYQGVMVIETPSLGINENSNYENATEGS